MHDSLLNFALCVIVIVALVAIIWETSAANIARDCDKLGSFYISDKTYKCEVAK
jgi:hypothetical protein